MLAKSGFEIGEIRPGRHKYDGVLNVLVVWLTVGCVFHEQTFTLVRNLGL